MEQLALLSSAVDVPGLSYVSEYVSEAEARALLEAIDREPWSHELERRRQIYGLSYGSARAQPKELGPLPPWVVDLAERIVRDGWLEDAVANVVVNEYLPGQGIGAHHDFPGFGPTVVAVSLGSPCILELTRDGRKELLDVAPRSLWVLSGEARTSWKHGIAARKADLVGGMRRPRGRRVSVTMRTRQKTPSS